MANSEVITTLIDMISKMLLYLLPVIAFLAGVTFMVTWFMAVVFGMGKRTFKG
jgi:hypothetical protein